MHEPTPATLNEYGDDVHPAFGFIQAHRISSTPGAVLFDSEIPHTHFVRVTLGRMTRKRDLNHDWLHPTSAHPLVEVDMSEAQWAQFVSSMNSSATPATIRSVGKEYDIPGLAFAPRLALSAAETKGAAQKAFDQIKQAVADLEALDPKAGVKARREAMRRLHSAVENAPANVAYATRMLTEHTENVVTKAKADIEAMVTHKAQALGLDPAQFGTTLEIEAGEKN